MDFAEQSSRNQYNRSDVENLFLQEMMVSDAFDLLHEDSYIDNLINFDSINIFESEFDEEPFIHNELNSIF